MGLSGLDWGYPVKFSWRFNERIYKAFRILFGRYFYYRCAFSVQKGGTELWLTAEMAASSLGPSPAAF